MKISAELESKKYIICLNIGDDNCSAFYLQRESYGAIKGFLSLDGDKSNPIIQIPTVMCFDEKDNTFIGKLSRDKSFTSVVDFIAPPPIAEGHKGWNGICPKAGGKKSFRDCMQLFIKTLWANIIRCNSDKIEVFADRTSYEFKTMRDIAIFVGYPDTYGWSGDTRKEAYKELIQSATGVESVFVVSKSFASAFGAV